MNNTNRIAFCGIMGALSLTFMLLWFLIPLATYACPAFAAGLLLPVAYEFKEKTAFTLYLAVSILAFVLVPDKEFVFMYIFVFGLYTVFKLSIDRLKVHKILKMIFKGIYAAVGICASYFLLLLVFPSPLLTSDMNDLKGFLLFAFLVLFTVTFLIYDIALTKLLLIYKYRFRHKIFKQ